MDKGRPITRRQFVALGAGVVVVACAAGITWETNRLVLTQVEVSSPRLPQSFDGLRIAHVSDYHNKVFMRGEPVMGLVRELTPDLIAITGDLVDRNRTNLDVGYALVDGCVATAPTYYVPGNHENGVKDRAGLYQHIRDLGAHVMIFSSEEVWRGNEAIRIAGVPDPVAPGHWLAGVAAQGPATTGDGVFTMLLSHRPETFDEYVAAEYDLVLTGHAHGGQVCLPGGQAILAPHQGFFPRYTHGVHVQGQTAMVVSRGIGESSFPIRVNCPPEVVLVTLRRS